MKLQVAAAILAAVGFTAACAQTDAGVTTKIKTQFASDDLVKARNIDVDTKDRVVTLSGEVRTPAEEEKALQLARNTDGVANVVDRLDVVPEAPPATATVEQFGSDATTTAEVKAKLLADTDVGGLKIDVDTKDHVVTLTGTVDSAVEKAKALRIAGEVGGVTRVEDQLTIKGKS
jgi:osmotically-inducible protein OsmY